MGDRFEIASAVAFLIWLVGIPVSFGAMLAAGWEVLSLFAAPFWPAVALIYVGHWIAS